MQIGIAIAGAAIGIYFLSAGTIGWYIKRSNIIERFIFIVIGLLLIHPQEGTDLVGIVLAILITIFEIYYKRRGRKSKIFY